MIPYGKQEISQSDIDAVVEVLKSDFLTQGPQVPLFETTVAAKVGARHAVAVNSATSALHIACLSLGLKPGDWLWTSPITFVASANCGVYCGAQIDFVDIDAKTYNLCPKALEAKLKDAEKKQRLPKVLVAVHLCGQPCDMESIYTLSKSYGFHVIEDASHAIGGMYKGKYIGDCRYSDITVFSFHPVKIITTAEGGMALTNSDQLAAKMNLLRTHGITRDENLMTGDSEGPWYYEQIDVGFNYRMTDLQAALGISQMERLDTYVGLRHRLAKRYEKLLKELPITTPWQHSEGYSAMHLYVIRLRLGEIAKSHREVFEALRQGGIGVNLHYIPVHAQPFYKKSGVAYENLSQAENYYKEAISLPLYPGMTFEEQDSVVLTLRKVLQK